MTSLPQQPPTAPHIDEMRDIRSELETPKKPNSRLWIGLLIGAVVILFIGALIQVFTPKKIEIPRTQFVTTNINDTLPHLTEVKYSGPLVDLPAEFSLYAAREPVPTQTVIDDLVAKFGLQKPDIQANYWLNDTVALIEDTGINNYTLILHEFNDDADAQLPIVDITQAEAVATAFMKQTFPTLPLSANMDNATYMLLSGESEPAESASEATGVAIPFSPTLEGVNIPVNFGKANSPAFTVIVDGKNTVRSLNFYPLFKQYTKVGSAAPISVEQALNQIRAGTASIIRASIVEFDRIPMSDLTSADFSSVSIEYRQDPNSDLTYPFYDFTGTGTNGKGVTAEIEVITPAVALTPNTR